MPNNSLSGTKGTASKFAGFEFAAEHVLWQPYSTFQRRASHRECVDPYWTSHSKRIALYRTSSHSDCILPHWT
eukprot:1572350-Rhodomonas_salina.1